MQSGWYKDLQCQKTSNFILSPCFLIIFFSITSREYIYCKNNLILKGLLLAGDQKPEFGNLHIAGMIFLLG